MPLKTDERPSDQSEGVKPEVHVGDTFHASFKVDVLKAEESDDGSEGKVEAIVSAFDVDYRMGWMTKHRITSAAFKASIAANPVTPLFFQHNWAWSEQPPIGTADASVVAKPRAGLKISGSFFLDTDGGRSTFKAIKAGALREWSIGYRITKFEVEEDDDGFDIVIVNEADLMEASSVLRGANPGTETLKVAAELPSELSVALSAFMQSTTEALDLLTKRVDGVEAAHELLIGTLEDGGFKGDEPPADGSGESVEPDAVGGDGVDVEAEAVAPQPPQQAPDSPAEDLAARAAEVGPDRLDRAMERAMARITSKWEDYIEQAGVGLDNPDADPQSRDDIGSLERVLRCLNKNKHAFDAIERTVEARVLAEQGSANL